MSLFSLIVNFWGQLRGVYVCDEALLQGPIYFRNEIRSNRFSGFAVKRNFRKYNISIDSSEHQQNEILYPFLVFSYIVGVKEQQVMMLFIFINFSFLSIIFKSKFKYLRLDR